MKSYVLDASVIYKWIFKTDDDEEHVDKALALLKLIELGQCKILQPVHWLAEIMGVVCRVESKHAIEILSSLMTLELPVKQEIEVYETATQLAIKHNHHLFDTLYHAVALESPNTVYITADTRYYKKAKTDGAIMLLANYS